MVPSGWHRSCMSCATNKVNNTMPVHANTAFSTMYAMAIICSVCYSLSVCCALFSVELLRRLTRYRIWMWWHNVLLSSTHKYFWKQSKLRRKMKNCKRQNTKHNQRKFQRKMQPSDWNQTQTQTSHSGSRALKSKSIRWAVRPTGTLKCAVIVSNCMFCCYSGSVYGNSHKPRFWRILCSYCSWTSPLRWNCSVNTG